MMNDLCMKYVCGIFITKLFLCLVLEQKIKTILNVDIENICVNLSPIKNISNEENNSLEQ